jgi:hypothetical protein
MLSSRTASYIEALNREGDNFDHLKWLKRVRKEETQAKAEFTSGESTAPQIGRPLNAPDCTGALIVSRPVFLTKITLVPKARSFRSVKSDAPQSRLRRRLEKVCAAWAAFQKSRDRDAVYIYLKEIFRTVEHYRVRRRTEDLLRCAFEVADIPFMKAANVFTAVIRCTSCGDVDNKTISKWARALRYVAHCKTPKTELKAFIKALGGVNACADRYARYLRGS